jgi:hypothetical protein
MAPPLGRRILEMSDARRRRRQRTDLEEEPIMRVLDPTAAHPGEADAAVPMTTSSSRRPAAGSVNAPTRELLAWVARCPRTYADAMEAWRSTCPRHTAWEDALDAGLIQIERGGGIGIGEARVTLTPRGRAVLAGP